MPIRGRSLQESSQHCPHSRAPHPSPLLIKPPPLSYNLHPSPPQPTNLLIPQLTARYSAPVDSQSENIEGNRSRSRSRGRFQYCGVGGAGRGGAGGCRRCSGGRWRMRLGAERPWAGSSGPGDGGWAAFGYVRPRTWHARVRASDMSGLARRVQQCLNTLTASGII